MPTNKKSQANKQPDPKTTRNYTPVIPGVKYLSIGEYSKLFSLNPVSVRRHCQRGNVPGAIKFERLWRIPVKEEELCQS